MSKRKRPPHPTRIFKEASEMQKAWEEYKKDVEIQAEKWLKIQYVGKDGDRKEDKYKLPLTLEGFRRYCHQHHGEVEQYFTNQDGYYDEFIGICSRIKNEIREDQITGGLLGVYNPSITQRLNNLTEHQKVESTGEIILNVSSDVDGLGEV